LRSRRAGLKRMGLLALALVLALGGLGVAHAVWTDEVYLEGTVETGTLDVAIMGCSSTFVYKTSTDNITVCYVDGSDEPSPSPGTLVAKAVTTYDNGGNDEDTATITFEGLFPEVDFQADLQLQYLGTVPAKVSAAEIFPSNVDPDPDIRDTKDAILAALWQLGTETKDEPDPNDRYGAWVDGVLQPFSGGEQEISNPLGIQLHQEDTVHITLHVRLPQTNPPGFDYDLTNLDNLLFTGKITVIQWNEYDDGS
jgi:hypothetical protein